MNININKEDRTPAYLQLYNSLRGEISTEVYPYKAKLPSKRLIAEETGLSVITVEHALELLCEEGYIEARERSGYFVIYRRSDFIVASLPLQSEYKIREQKEKNYYFPFTNYAKAVRKVLLTYENQLFEKSPAYGCEELKFEICSYLARSNGIRLKTSQVVIGSGAEYLYGLIAQMYGKSHCFAIEEPCYDKIYKVYRSFGIEIEKMPLSINGISSLDLIKSKANLLHVTPFNSFPSGISISASKKNEYIRWAQERSGILIEDNYESELTISKKSEDTLYSMAEGKNVIYINTFSKTIAPSVRVGYMVLPENLLAEFTDQLGFYSCTVPVLDQLVLAEILKNGDYERHINRVRRKKRKEIFKD